MKMVFREQYNKTYTFLWISLLKIGKIDEALFAAEQGRARTLSDNLLIQYKIAPPSSTVTNSIDSNETIIGLLSRLSTQLIFLVIDGLTINIWFLNKGRKVVFRQGTLQGDSPYEDPTLVLLMSALKRIGAGGRVTCENRTLDEFTCDRTRIAEKSTKEWKSHYRLQTILLGLFMKQLLVQFVTCLDLKTTNWSLHPTKRCA